MIVHVVERALRARNVSRAIVATDDSRVFDAVLDAGYEAVMTRQEHQSGSDRLAEVVARLETAKFIINVQGDEPLISVETIELVVDRLLTEDRASIVTASEAIDNREDLMNPDVVKVVTGGDGRALYFSRSPIPYPRDAVRRHGTLDSALRAEPQLLKSFRKHTGIYAYRREVLLEFNAWPQSELELMESLEQLRALERGANIFVVDAAGPSIGVDTAEDLEKVRLLYACGEEARVIQG